MKNSIARGISALSAIFIVFLASVLIFRSYGELEIELNQAKSIATPAAILHYRNALSWALPWQEKLSRSIVRDALDIIERQDAESRGALIQEIKRGIDGSRSGLFANGWRWELSQELAKLSGSDRRISVTPLPSFWPNLLAQGAFIIFIISGLALCFRGVTDDGRLGVKYKTYLFSALLSLILFFVALSVA